MEGSKLIDLLKKMIDEAEELRNYHRESPKFKTWEDKVYRRIINIYGEDSREYHGFRGINFHKKLTSSAESISSAHKAHMGRCLDETKLFLEGLIEDIELFPNKDLEVPPASGAKKVFISHSSKDCGLAKEITYLLEALGIPSDLIFNSSMPGYGVKPGEDWVETLKAKISTEGVVISLISENYYKSAVSLCEMGATWVLSKTHFPIVIPPLTFEEIKGVIPTKHGIMINDSERWSELKDELEKIFELTPIPVPKWEGKKKDILERIEKLLETK